MEIGVLTLSSQAFLFLHTFVMLPYDVIDPTNENIVNDLQYGNANVINTV